MATTAICAALLLAGQGARLSSDAKEIEAETAEIQAQTPRAGALRGATGLAFPAGEPSPLPARRAMQLGINLFGIESPGLTSSLAIADHVADMASA